MHSTFIISRQSRRERGAGGRQTHKPTPFYGAKKSENIKFLHVNNK